MECSSWSSKHTSFMIWLSLQREARSHYAGAGFFVASVDTLLLSPHRQVFTGLSCLFDCAAAFGTRKQTLITSTRDVILIILSLVPALIASYPFAAAARSPLLFRSNPQPGVSQSVQVRT